MQFEDSFKISVKVQQPELKTELGGASKYYIYHIHGADKFAEFSIYRRYSDFVILKNSMMARWPGVYVPSLPEKKFIGNNDTQFVDYRRNGLQQFLNTISHVQFLWYADQFQLFIKNASTDVEKSLGNLGKTNFKEISAKYQSVFSKRFEQKEMESSLSGKIQEFKAYLKNSLMLLEKMGKVAESMTETRRKFQEKYSFLLSTFLPDYQQKCVVHYLQSQDEASWNIYFAKNSTQNLGQNVKDLLKTFGSTGFSETTQSLKIFKHNALSLTNELIKQQIRELNNFNQIILAKQHYDGMKHRAISKVKDFELEESKISAGKQSIVSKLKNQNKEEQLKNNKILLQKAKAEQQEIQKVCRLIEIILADHQLQRFKTERQKNYYKAIKMIATAQKRMYEAEGQLWNRIAGFEGEIEVKMKTQQFQENHKQKSIVKQIKINEQKLQKNELKEHQNLNNSQKESSSSIEKNHKIQKQQEKDEQNEEEEKNEKEKKTYSNEKQDQKQEKSEKEPKQEKPEDEKDDQND